MQNHILFATLAVALCASSAPAQEPTPEELSLTESTEAENGDLNWIEKKIVAFGRNPKYRHRLTAWLNKDGGKWVRRTNAIKLAKAWKRTNVPHFETVTLDLWRGGQPNPKGFAELKAKGVKTIINLRMEDDSERGVCMMQGLRYVYLPLPDTNPPTPEQLATFEAAMKDPSRGITYIHCAAGTFRTGTMVAVYRMDHGWPLEKALEELFAHGFDPEMMDAPYQLAFLEEYGKMLAEQGARAAK